MPTRWPRRRRIAFFTTHTPVKPEHDRFSPAMMDYALHGYRALLPVPWADILGLGRVDPKNADEPFCMTVLALKLSRAANAVSELHGQVSRHMWQSLYPGVPEDKVPIGHITNGMRLLGWMKGSVRQFWRRKLTIGTSGEMPEGMTVWRKRAGADWAATIHKSEFWQRMVDP